MWALRRRYEAKTLHNHTLQDKERRRKQLRTSDLAQTPVGHHLVSASLRQRQLVTAASVSRVQPYLLDPSSDKPFTVEC